MPCPPRLARVARQPGSRSRVTIRGPVYVEDPSNLYFTPDGAHALVMAERMRRIDVRNPRTMALEHSLPVPCHGATKLIRVIDLDGIRTRGAGSTGMARRMGGPRASLMPGASAMPQDVRLTPDGTRFLVADMLRNGIWVVRSSTLRVERFIPTGRGAHGIYPDREGRRILVSNRDGGSISVLDASSLAITARWKIPGGGSPDMGGVSADGSKLWLSGRYNSEVYVMDTGTGRLLKRIKVDAGPHGLLVWPQPGTVSLGHTGNMRYHHPNKPSVHGISKPVPHQATNLGTVPPRTRQT